MNKKDQKKQKPLTAMTRPPVDSDPILTISTSPLLNFCTFAAFFPPSVRTPSNLRNRKYAISISANISGNVPTAPRI